MDKLCIFDLDGTLLDTLKDIFISLNYALVKNGLPTKTLEEVRTSIGNGMINLVKRAIGPNEDKFDSVLSDYRAHYDVHCNDHTKLFPGIKLLLKNLKIAKYKIVIVSNKNDEAVQELFKIYFDGIVDAAFGVKDGMKVKPSPDTVNYAMQQFNVDKSDSIFIGDSPVDEQTAINAGVEYRIVTWGYKSISELRDIKEGKIVSNPTELEKEIRKANPQGIDVNEILRHCDHTLLAVDAKLEDIYALCDDAIKYNTASVCIPPCYVKAAKEYVGDKMRVCTVIGFPNGYNTLRTKMYETKDAIKNGADEIDMVINVSFLKSRNFTAIRNEIRALRKICKDKVLKVIIETCLLDRSEKIKLCKYVTTLGADYIKTSTGFSKAGATKEDIILFKKFIGPEVKMKAAGGIRTIEDAWDYLNLGCDRLGTSSIVKIVKQREMNE